MRNIYREECTVVLADLFSICFARYMCEYLYWIVITTRTGRTIIYHHHRTKGVSGVGVVVSPEWESNIVNITRVSERIMMIQFTVGKSVLKVHATLLNRASKCQKRLNSMIV